MEWRGDNIMKMLILGYGNVGKSFVKLLLQKKESVPELKDVEIGGIVNRRGIMLGYRDEFEVNLKGDVFTAYEKVKPDIIIDMMSANYKDGNPSLTLYKTALKDGVSIITTNKAPLALAYREVMSLVGKGRLGFQGTVMSGTPSINLLRILPGAEVKRIRGILNGTTNFILTRMYKGQPFEEALKEAQRLGYAEEDPILDINGFDAAAKLTILANFAMKKNVSIRDIKFEGIQNVKEAIRGNKKVKLIAYADDSKIEVFPTELTPEDPLYYIDGVENALEITTDIQTTVIRGPGAGPINAAYGAFSDLILLKRGFI
jgi:homoserine dehydrogenase